MMYISPLCTTGTHEAAISSYFLCTYTPLCLIKEMPLQIEVALSEISDKQSVCT